MLCSAHGRVAGRDGNIAGCQGVAAKDPGLLQQAITHGLGSDVRPRAIEAHPTAAAEADRQKVRHAEVGAHAADVRTQRALARKSGGQQANVGGRAADVGDDGIAQTRQVGGAAHGVGRTRGERQHRVLRDHVGIHQGAVVLTDEERCLDPERGQCRGERRHHIDGHAGQRCIHDGGVFALQQANLANRLESVMAMSGASCATISAARSSMAALTGENSPQIAAAFSPLARMSRAAAATACSSRLELIRPSK